MFSCIGACCNDREETVVEEANVPDDESTRDSEGSSHSCDPAMKIGFRNSMDMSDEISHLKITNSLDNSSPVWYNSLDNSADTLPVKLPPRRPADSLSPANSLNGDDAEEILSPVRQGVKLPCKSSAREIYVMDAEGLGVEKVNEPAQLGDGVYNQVAHIERLIGQYYDIVAAGLLIDALEKPSLKSGSKEWQYFLASAMYAIYCRRLKFFHDVGLSCCGLEKSWFQAFQNADGTQTIHAFLDPKDSTLLRYRVRAVIPTKLTTALLVANEVQFMPEWNKLVTKQPKVLGRRTAHYMVINYQMSILAGMFKVDVLSEVRRFTHVDGGFMAEYIESVDESSASYVKPAPGYKRPHTQVQNVWAACGPNHTVLTQVATLQLPFPVSPWVVSKVGGIAGNKIIGGLVNNSLMASVPGNRWETALAEDIHGLYARLDECALSEASFGRAPVKGNQVDEFDLSRWFETPIPRT